MQMLAKSSHASRFSLLNILMFILMYWAALTWANTVDPKHQFNLKLQHYIDVVNHTKTVLDDPNAKPTALEQKQALCMRIQAYRNIAKLSQDNLDIDSARVMNSVAQRFLDRQQTSFNASAMSERVFCAGANLKMIEIDR